MLYLFLHADTNTQRHTHTHTHTHMFQVKVRTLESGKVVEKTTTISELVEYLQQRQLRQQHSVERSDSNDSRENVR